MKKALFGAAVLAMGLLAAPKSDAAVLTINDGTDVWTLDVEENCTDCLVTLEVVFGGARTGQFIDEVQWDLTNPNVNPTDIGFDSTTAGSAASWTFDFANANGNDCGGGDPNAVCGFFDGNGVLVGAAGTSFEWVFNTTFAAELTNLVAGNIRASYNFADGKNAGIFSPDGGTFGTTTNTPTTTDQPTTTDEPTTGNVPEPALLSLLGFGLVGAATRLRRKA